MQGKKLHDFLFELYDYANYIADKIKPNNLDNGMYFLTLIYIEDIMDTYGRGMILDAAKESADPGIDPSASLSEAHNRIDHLRQRMTVLSREYNFDDSISQATNKMSRDWHHIDDV